MEVAIANHGSLALVDEALVVCPVSAELYDPSSIRGIVRSVLADIAERCGLSDDNVEFKEGFNAKIARGADLR